MNRSTRLSVIALALWCGIGFGSPASAEARPSRETAPAPTSILFIGNSFTYYNNSLHMHVRELARSLFEAKHDGPPRVAPHAKAMTISGAHLADHVLGARGMIRDFRDAEHTGSWDVVVLQGFSREPIEAESAPSFRRAAKRLDAWIRESGARTALFMTWAYRDRPEMTAPLAGAYEELGKEIGALVVPVGRAFERARREDPNVNLYDPDGMHPSRLGTYLAANVFFAALYGESPVGASYTAHLTPEEAAFAQRIAWLTVRAPDDDALDP